MLKVLESIRTTFKLSEIEFYELERFCWTSKNPEWPILSRVSSEKEKSFREIFFSWPFRFVFAFRSLVKNAKIFAKFRFNLLREKMWNFREIEKTKISRKNKAKISRKNKPKISHKKIVV